ncbi:MAG: GNAT family N-acetyltransferase [Salinivenus sp.]
MSRISIRRANTSADVESARRLFRAYIEGLDFDLDFQNVETELQALPGPYAAPDGAILLAEVEGRDVGVVAVQPLDADGVCEMKRLYVCPDARGRGVGRAIGEALLNVARDLGYDTMRLDTVASMKPARALYRSLGFEERSAYYHNPLDNVVYMERSL